VSERNVSQVYCHMLTQDIVKSGHRHERLLGGNWKQELKIDGELGRIRMRACSKCQRESHLKDVEILTNHKLEYWEWKGE
jgi:hypothetical protein